MTTQKPLKLTFREWSWLAYAVLTVAAFGFLIGAFVTKHYAHPGRVTNDICVAAQPGACPSWYKPAPTRTVTGDAS